MGTPRQMEFAGVTAPRRKPTRQHRPAMWENLLGTVYAMNDERQVRYFDYDWPAAREWSGVEDPDRDPRIWKETRRRRWNPRAPSRRLTGPKKGRLVLWVRSRSPAAEE